MVYREISSQLVGHTISYSFDILSKVYEDGRRWILNRYHEGQDAT